MEQRYLADSNTIIDYAGNKMPHRALLVLDSYFNESLTISIISKIEVLGFNGDVQELQRLDVLLDWQPFFLLMMQLLIKLFNCVRRIKLRYRMLSLLLLHWPMA